MANQNNSLILNKLNDVCLIKVFQFIHLRDLCNCAEVCQRFKDNADQVFKSTNTNLDLLKLIEGDRDYHADWFMVRWLSEKFLKSAEQLFRNFGPFIEALRVTGRGECDGMDENELMELVQLYCPSLDELTLYNMGNDDDFNKDLLSLFARLEKLSVSTDGYVDVCDSFIAILSDCHKLKHLHVCGPATLWMKHKFPKLETFAISNNWQFDYTDFETFLESHTNLRTLRYDDTEIVSDFFAMISKSLMKLETFFCNIGGICDYDDDEDEVEENILQLSKLKSLKNLTFMCETSSLKRLVDAFEKENTPIEVFEIVDCQIDSELITGLSKLKSMKTLKLTRCEIAVETFINSTNTLEVIIEDIQVVDGHNDKLVQKRPEKDQRSSANILKILNDDCLIEIFKLLNLPDLCNVADVCRRFKQNAQTAFQLHHTSFKTNEIAKTDHKGFFYTDLLVAEQLFRNFGFFIQELSLKGRCLRNGNEQETILYLATKYCVSLKFHTLTLDNINIDRPMRWIFPLLKLFYHLPKLQLHSCRLNADFGKFISICVIPTIQVYSLYGSTEWMTSYTFWNLRIFILLETWQPDSVMNDFIKLNGHLQILLIHQSNFSSQIFKTIAQYMPELRGFGYSGKNPRDRKTRKNVMHLARLKSLTNLTLNCSLFSVKHLLGEFVKETIPIAELNICFGTVDMEVVEKLFHLRAIKSLQLRRVKMDNVSLVDVVQKLPELTELDIDIKGIGVNQLKQMLPFAKNLTKLTIGCERSQVQIDIIEYQTILEIVKSREKAIKLCITINSEKRHVFVPQHLLQESSYWLKIDNEIFDNFSSIMSDSDSELGDADSSSVDDSDNNSVMSVEDSDASDEDPDDNSAMSADDSDDDIDIKEQASDEETV